jgi:hypothetical protein
MREQEIPNARAPASTFDPRRGGAEIPSVSSADDGADVPLPPVDRPASDEDLAYASIPELAHLLRARKVTSVELTELFLGRLRRHNDALHAVITYTEDRALDAARQADRELDAGSWRGPLHGVPYGAKDLLAVESIKTTWGAAPYKNQTIDETATVIERLDDAGAVLVAKLSLGALAWGDVWYDATTKLRAVRDRLRNPRFHRVALHAVRRHGAPAHVRHGGAGRGHGAFLDDGQAGSHCSVGP